MTCVKLKLFCFQNHGPWKGSFSAQLQVCSGYHFNGFLLHLMFPTFRSISASRHRDLEAVSLDTSPEVVALVVNWAYGMGRSVISCQRFKPIFNQPGTPARHRTKIAFMMRMRTTISNKEDLNFVVKFLEIKIVFLI